MSFTHSKFSVAWVAFCLCTILALWDSSALADSSRIITRPANNVATPPRFDNGSHDNHDSHEHDGDHGDDNHDGHGSDEHHENDDHDGHGRGDHDGHGDDEHDDNGQHNGKRDSDHDGVVNAKDKCPNTPKGTKVDAKGCPITTVLDDDKDGVNNAVDQCPNTAAGETVDANGCSQSQLDDDKDGVNNAVDQCANTSTGETVDTNGCAASQLDDDKDGVSNAVDQCASTPTGETVDANGCSASQLDDDNDGVNNELDQCPNTPTGESVNAVGCSATQLDDDADGINNAVDQCANTPVGEAVNANGCAASQLDDDSDGVSNAFDQCTSTPTGETVDTNGCSQTQLDDDHDGINNVTDQCPGTGAGQAVNTNGCAETQLDDDGDAVKNANDQCPNTPAGEPTDFSGCAASERDGDQDGISDALDQCPNTPTSEIVNALGCSGTQLDDDKDGVNNASDQCPFTLAGNPVNTVGCSVNEADPEHDGYPVDTDHDGYPDVVDKFPADASEWADLDGDGIGDNSDPDRDGDGVVNNTDIFPDDATETKDLDHDGIGNNADPDRDGDTVANEYDPFPDDSSRSALPIITIDSPHSLITVGSTPITISGKVDANAVSLTVNGVPVSIDNGHYTADVALTEGHNTVIARMVDSTGITSTASILVSLDMTPPYLTVESHKDGEIVHSNTITVTGLINDIVRGTIEEHQAIVTVNGVEATIVNRSYEARGITLVEGDNLITVVGSDQVGNTEHMSIHVVYEPVVGKHLQSVSGDNQTSVIGASLPQPFTLRVLDENNQPVANKNVVFRVAQGDGTLSTLNGSSTNYSGRGVMVVTDDQGLASASFTLGLRAGVGNNKVRARVVGYEDEVIFVASATVNIGDKLSINSGHNQRGGTFQPLPAPFVTVVTDNGANVVQGARVEYKVIAGNGLFTNGEPSIISVTDSDGRASAQLTLGGVTGLDAQRVEATLLDDPAGENISAGFTASAFVPGEPGLTTISGIVLDNQDNPLPGVIVRVDGTTRQAIVDDKGLFKITEAPVGPVHLVADGTTTTVAGEYPSLSYNIVTVSGVDNPLSSPIYMVKLNLANAKQAGATDVTITLPDVPGFKLEVPAGSVTFPGGSKEGLLSVTTVNSSKMPMLPPNGMQPQFIVTIQPTGAMFDPPARLTMPNVDGHEPGRQVEMFSYDHDLEEFVAIGLGTVSEDGSVITSNPGVGVVKAGWHCNAQPGGDGCCTGGQPLPCNECQRISPTCASKVEVDPAKEGKEIPGKDCIFCKNGDPEDKCKEFADNAVSAAAQSGYLTFGKTICCKGKKIQLTFPQNYQTTTGNAGQQAVDIQEACVQQHEKAHVDDANLTCPDNTCGINPTSAYQPSEQVGHCPIWSTQVGCYQAGVVACTTDVCISAMEKLVTEYQTKLNDPLNGCP